MKIKQTRIFQLLALMILPSNIYAFDDHHFYRASYLFDEPRFEKSWLGTFETWIGAGEACDGYDSLSNSVALFDIWGVQNMRVLGNGVPDKDINNSADLALINLAALPANGCFAKLSFPGTFKIIEGGFRYFQNYACGFFTEFQLPVRSMLSCPAPFLDLSPENNVCCPNRSSPQWQEFLRQFDAILTRYNLCYCPSKQTGLGDLIMLWGWTRNFQQTEVLDFVDTTIKAGVLLPTAPCKNEDYIFAIPLGYNGHFGFPFSFDMSLGLYGWFSAGFHAGALAFLDRNACKRIKTDINQSGILKLAKANVTVESGAIWDLGGYIKADHLGKGLSITLGYTFVSKQADHICSNTDCPPPNILIDANIANHDETLQGWNMNTFHLFIEYDFNRENYMFGPRVGFIYNVVLRGSNIFNNNIVGGTFGLDIAWRL
jgi:hypothetical protein